MRTTKAKKPKSRTVRLPLRSWCIVRTTSFARVLSHLETDMPETRKALNRVVNAILSNSVHDLLLDDREGIILLKELVDALQAAEEELRADALWQML